MRLSSSLLSALCFEVKVKGIYNMGLFVGLAG